MKRTAIAPITSTRPRTVATVRLPPEPIIRSPRKMANMPSAQITDQRPLPRSSAPSVAGLAAFGVVISIAVPP